MNHEQLVAAHRAMLLSRSIERWCIEQSPHWYAGIGEEAVVVGAFSALAAEDFAAPHYRGALVIPWLRGRPLEDVLGCVAQHRGSPTRGRLYGAFVGALELGVMPYVTMVLGPNLAVAAGAALAFRQRGEARVALATLGDGTAGTGDFHESLNLAASLALPCVFVCQNNQFSISTSTRATLAGESIADWAARYGMPSRQIDGNDVQAVHAAVGEAVAAARGGEGPSFVEALTYRQTGHFGGDPAAYRAREQHAAWVARDPIARAAAALRAQGVEQAQLDRVAEEVAAEMRRAAELVARGEPLTAADLGAEEVPAHA
jgi:acetoin:2,6-dichlorophenolindophenol oxidoreductase subunit alpha